MTDKELSMCTKEELIDVIQQSRFASQSSFSEILFNRWKKLSKELLVIRHNHTQALDIIDGKERDKLAKEFNTEKDLDRKLNLIEKIKVFDDQFKAHLKEYEEIRKLEINLGRLYKSINIQRQKERNCE